MIDIQPKKIKLPDNAQPHKGTIVLIEDEKRSVTIWLELCKDTYRVCKTVEVKGLKRH